MMWVPGGPCAKGSKGLLWVGVWVSMGVWVCCPEHPWGSEQVIRPHLKCCRGVSHHPISAGSQGFMSVCVRVCSCRVCVCACARARTRAGVCVRGLVSSNLDRSSASYAQDGPSQGPTSRNRHSDCVDLHCAYPWSRATVFSTDSKPTAIRP